LFQNGSKGRERDTGTCARDYLQRRRRFEIELSFSVTLFEIESMWRFEARHSNKKLMIPEVGDHPPESGFAAYGKA
jgi:hypothetical protein